jgi:hypothetical protein
VTSTLALLKKDSNSILTLVSRNSLSNVGISGATIRQVLDQLPSLPIKKRKRIRKLEESLGDTTLKAHVVSIFF